MSIILLTHLLLYISHSCHLLKWSNVSTSYPLSQPHTWHHHHSYFSSWKLFSDIFMTHLPIITPILHALTYYSTSWSRLTFFLPHQLHKHWSLHSRSLLFRPCSKCSNTTFSMLSDKPAPVISFFYQSSSYSNNPLTTPIFRPSNLSVDALINKPIVNCSLP